MSLSKRTSLSLVGVGLLAVAGFFVVSTSSPSHLPAMTVYKSSACVCCGAWIEHMEDAGFDVEVVEDRNLMAVKSDRGVPRTLHSCHTATVAGYTLEGHVPAEDVLRMLRERPSVAGIGVGGMPQGSPGMPGIPEPYTVESFLADGSTSSYARH